MTRWIVSTLLLLGAVGCASEATSRQFAVPFDRAEPKLRELYPSYLPTGYPMYPGRLQGEAKFSNHMTIRRDEVTRDPDVRIVITEGEKTVNRKTEIVLREGPTTSSCDVSVQASTSKKSVVFPSRDKEFEDAVLKDITAALEPEHK